MAWYLSELKFGGPFTKVKRLAKENEGKIESYTRVVLDGIKVDYANVKFDYQSKKSKPVSVLLIPGEEWGVWR